MKLPLLLRAAQLTVNHFLQGVTLGFGMFDGLKDVLCCSCRRKGQSGNHTGARAARSRTPGCPESERNEISTSEKELINAKMLPTTQFICLNGMWEAVLTCWPEEALPKA